MFSYKLTSFRVMCEKSSLIGQNSMLIKQMVMFLYKMTSFKVMCEKLSLIVPNWIWFAQAIVLQKVQLIVNFR